mmetsp:Transcript_9154/g.13151  ORF Transcript_9154/g.13151 Transcript_9154/m.13151 type:complete len:293 (+) Transcript_9154:109-987(+)
MKSVTYVIAAAGVASAASGGSKNLEWTKQELEESTQAFVRENEENVKFVRNKNLRKLKSSSSDTWRRELRGGKGGKVSGGWSGSGSGSSGWSGSGSGSGSGDGWSQGGKGGKTGRGGDYLGGGHAEEAFCILPTSCAGKCISSDVDEDYAFKDALETCDHDESQKWNVLSDGSYVMVESYDKPHWCISVNYQDGDEDETFEETCKGEYYLALKECGAYGTQWYFTGGQLISSMCWAGGLSSYMSVYLDDDKECEDNLSVYGKSPNDAVMRADTFMFVSHLPESPIEVENVYT